MPRSRRRPGLRALLIAASWAVAAASAGQAPDAPVSRAERRVWRSSDYEVGALERSGLLSRDTALVTYVTALARRVAPSTPDRPRPLVVHVVLDPAANAFALPTGHVYLHAGLLAVLEREDQLAHVLGHEAAHVARRHAATRASHAEAEADVWAVAALVRAGLDVCAAAEVFDQLLLTHDGDGEPEAERFHGSHPALEARRQAAATLAEGARGTPCASATPDENFLGRTATLRAGLVELWVRADRPARAVAHADRWLLADSARSAVRPGAGDDRTRATVWAWRAEAARQIAASPDGLARAADDARRAVALDPGLATAHRTLGAVAEAQGDGLAARASYAAYLAARPDAPDRRFVRARLAALDAAPEGRPPESPAADPAGTPP